MGEMQFSDFEPYNDAISNADLRLRVLGMEYPQYTITHASVGRFDLQWACEGSGQLSEGVTDRDGAGLYVNFGPHPLHLNGMSLDPHEVVYFPPWSEFCFACDRAGSWLSVKIPLEVLQYPETDGAGDNELPDTISILTPPDSLVRRLQSLVTSYLTMQSRTPLLEQSLLAREQFQLEMRSVVRQISLPHEHRKPALTSVDTGSGARHNKIAIEAADLIEAAIEDSEAIAGVEGIARELGVSERTLSTAYRKRFGVSPRQYFQAMRLNRARRMLKLSEGSEVRIADVAAACGYWDGGRFAARYLQLFGELPSETLRA